MMTHRYLCFYFLQEKEINDFALLIDPEGSVFVSSLEESKWTELDSPSHWGTFTKMFPEDGKLLSLKDGTNLYYNTMYYNFFVKAPHEAFGTDNQVYPWREKEQAKAIFAQAQEYYLVFWLEVAEELMAETFEEYPAERMEGFPYGSTNEAYFLSAFATIVRSNSEPEEIALDPYEGMDFELIYTNLNPVGVYSDIPELNYIEPCDFNQEKSGDPLDNKLYQGLLSVTKKTTPETFKQDFLTVGNCIQGYPSLGNIKWEVAAQSLPPLEEPEALDVNEFLQENRWSRYRPDWLCDPSDECPPYWGVVAIARRNQYRVYFTSYNNRLTLCVNYTQRTISLSWDYATVTHKEWALSPELASWWDDIIVETVWEAIAPLEWAKHWSFLLRKFIPLTDEKARVFAFPSELTNTTLESKVKSLSFEPSTISPEEMEAPIN